METKVSHCEYTDAETPLINVIQASLGIIKRLFAHSRIFGRAIGARTHFGIKRSVL